MKNSSSSIAFLKAVFPTLILFGALVFAQGCANYRLEIHDSDPTKPPYETEMLHAFLWGIWYNPQVLTAKCNDGINDVVVKSNYLYDLVSVVTLGIWMPIEVDYRCKAPRGQRIQ
jgi:hypothetical protein